MQRQTSFNQTHVFMYENRTEKNRAHRARKANGKQIRLQQEIIRVNRELVTKGEITASIMEKRIKEAEERIASIERNKPPYSAEEKKFLNGQRLRIERCHSLLDIAKKQIEAAKPLQEIAQDTLSGLVVVQNKLRLPRLEADASSGAVFLKRLARLTR